jgi:hypothetical protein
MRYSAAMPLGTGSLINNQPPGTTAYFCYRDQRPAFTSTASESKTVPWTSISWVIAC